MPLSGKTVRLGPVCAGAAFILLGAASVDGQSQAQRPRHHADDGFRNPWGLREHHQTPASVTLPFFVRRAVAGLLPDRGTAPDAVEPDIALMDSVDTAGGFSITWVGHSTFLVQMGGMRFLTDPTWSRTASPLVVGPRRFVPPGLDIDRIGRIDFVIISHNHYDHMDIDTLRKLSDAGTTFLVPLANGETLERHDIAPIAEMDWWQSQTIGDAEVHCIPARHWSRRGISDMDRALWSGWVVRAGGRSFYFAGDTGAFPGFAEVRERFGPMDLAAVPIGAYEPRAMMEPAHLNPEEAVDALVALDAARGVAMHFGTFDLSDEQIDEPPRRFLAASRAVRRGPAVDWVMSVGETREF